jgi:hypothetical protein
VWHKLRESKLVLDSSLSEVLQGFQAQRKPIPGRFSPTSQDAPNRIDIKPSNKPKPDLFNDSL